ncbi:MAG: hypothetical protein ACRD7E_21805, partial [Bryobacteraceae bacterium]
VGRIPYGSSPETCPVRAYRNWIGAAQIESKPFFRRIDRHEHVHERPLYRDTEPVVCTGTKSPA